MTALYFDIPGDGRIFPSPERLMMASYSGRFAEDVERHVAEMRARGVPPPRSTPVFYPVLTCLLSQNSRVKVVGSESAPEVEFVVFSWQDELYVSVGDDQHDRAMEKNGFSVHAKNLSQKPIATSAWRLDTIRDHWDQLMLVMYADDVLVQQGTVDRIMPPEQLIANTREPGSDVMVYSGTIPYLTALPEQSQRFSISLVDPILDRRITHEFLTEVIS